MIRSGRILKLGAHEQLEPVSTCFYLHIARFCVPLDHSPFSTFLFQTHHGIENRFSNIMQRHGSSVHWPSGTLKSPPGGLACYTSKLSCIAWCFQGLARGRLVRVRWYLLDRPCDPLMTKNPALRHVEHC
jgi:hypothetical protein